MSKLVKLSKRRANSFARRKSKYVKTDVHDDNTTTILIPERRSNFYKRTGKYSVNDNNAPEYVFKNFSVTKILPEKIQEIGKNNQFRSSVVQIDSNTFGVYADFDKMDWFLSSNPSQPEEALWVGLVIGTGESTIAGIVYNDTYTLGSADIAEANVFNAPAGSFILWVRLNKGRKTIVLTLNNKKTAITILPVNVRS